MFFALIFTLKEKRQHKSDKEFENEEKRKSAVTFVTALFFLVAGTGISRRASQSEWTLGGFTMKSQTASHSFFLHSHSLLKVHFQHFLKCKKPVINDWLFLVAGTGLEPMTFGL
jgi:hypothetical protein